MSIAIKAAKFQGDPGLFGFLGSAAKKLGGAAFRTFVPGPIRTAVSVGAGFVAGRARSRQPSLATSFRAPTRVSSFQPARPGVGSFRPQTTAVTRVPGIRGAVQRFLPGGETGFETVQAAAEGGMLKGFHLNKTGYFLKDGTFVEPFSRMVRNRRRNPGNMRAADRAISRIESAKRMAKRLGRITVRSKCPK